MPEKRGSNSYYETVVIKEYSTEVCFKSSHAAEGPCGFIFRLQFINSGCSLCSWPTDVLLVLDNKKLYVCHPEEKKPITQPRSLSSGSSPIARWTTCKVTWQIVSFTLSIHNFPRANEWWISQDYGGHTWIGAVRMTPWVVNPGNQLANSLISEGLGQEIKRCQWCTK